MRLERAHVGLVWAYLRQQKWPPSEYEYRLLLAEALDGRVWAGVVGETPLALGGVMLPHPELAGTAWLAVLPDVGQKLLPAVLLMRRVIHEAALRHRPGVVCCIDVGNERGARLARCLGFQPTERRVARLREWRLG